MGLTRITSDGITDAAIVNADINASAGIAGTKISTDFGSQNILTTGKLGVGTTSLNSVFPVTIQAQYPGIQFLDAQGTDSFGINADGGVLKLQVGVGGSSPSQVLQIATASTTITNNLNANAGLDVSGNTTFVNGNRTLDLTLADNPSTGNVGCQFRAGTSDFLGLAAGAGTGIGLVVDDSNNVGIGVINPRTELDLSDGQLSFSHRTDYSIRFYNGNGNNWSSINNPSAADGNATNHSELEFRTASGVAMHMATDKKIGINTQDPTGNFHIRSASATTDDLDMLVIDGGSTGFNQGNDANTDYGIQFKGCSFATGGFGIQQRIGAQILFHKNGSWNASNGGGGECKTDIIFTSSSGTFNSSPSTLAQTERMVIDSSGRVKIGGHSYTASSHSDDLVVGSQNSGHNRGITILNHSGQDGRIGFAEASGTNSGTIKYSHGSNIMQFFVEAGEMVRLNNTSVQNTPAMQLKKPSAASNVQSHMIHLIVGGHDRGALIAGSSFGASAIVGSISDYRVKTNIRNYTGGWDNIKALPVKIFDINKEGEEATDVKGWIAHEVQAVIPEAVGGAKDAKKADGSDDYQTLGYNVFMPDVVGALQTAIAKIETLEAKVAALETK